MKTKMPLNKRPSLFGLGLNLASLFILVFFPFAAIAQKIAQKTDWSVFLDSNPLECWSVAAPTKTVNKKNGQIVSVKRSDILIMVSFKPSKNVSGQVAFTGGYPFKKGSIVEVVVDGGGRFRFETSDAWAWPTSAKEDAKVVRAFQKARYVTIKGKSSRGVDTEDTFSLLGFTAATKEAARRCGAELKDTTPTPPKQLKDSTDTPPKQLKNSPPTPSEQYQPVKP